MLGNHRVMQGGALELNLQHVAARVLHGLADCGRHFARLATTNADATGAVTDHGQRRKAENPAALDDLGHTPDVDQFFLKIVAACIGFFESCHDIVLRIPNRFRAPRRPVPSRAHGT